MPIFRVHRALPLHGTYLWVFVVTLSTHEISNECLILVHLCQADPEGRKVSAVQVAPPSAGRLGADGQLTESYDLPKHWWDN